jgi:hypothetical protein
VAPAPWHRRVAAAIEPALPWAVLGWLVGVLGLAVWHLGGWWSLARAKRRGVRAVGGATGELFERLSTRLCGERSVRLLQSARVAVPVVVGWLRPAVLLPATALTGLTPEQLRAVLAHELAHVRRHDALVRAFQAAVETLLFYHPAVWWVSGRLRQASEECCDEVAVDVCRDRRRYAEAEEVPDGHRRRRRQPAGASSPHPRFRVPAEGLHPALDRRHDVSAAGVCWPHDGGVGVRLRRPRRACLRPSAAA